jgi:hypothetical protein
MIAKWPDQPEVMQTRKGRRIIARPSEDGGICLIIFNIEMTLTADESHQLRDLLQAAELAAERQGTGDV